MDVMNYVTSRKVPLLHCLRLFVTSDPQLLLRAIMPHFSYMANVLRKLMPYLNRD